MKKITANMLEDLRKSYLKRILPDSPMILVGMGTCGIGNGADVLFAILQNHIEVNRLNCVLKPTGCFGFCAEEPLVTVYQPDKPLQIGRAHV